MEGMLKTPTPGDTRPASPNGTRNNAKIGGENNWVTSYKTRDLITGAPLEVNMAGVGDGSLFGPGYAVRYVTGSVAHTAGEGANWKQSPDITGGALQNLANYAVWGRQMQNIIEECKCKRMK